MQTINIDLPVSREQLEDMQENETFFIVQKTRGGKLVAAGSFDDDGVYRVAGYFFEVDGKLASEKFSDDYFEYWMDVAMGVEVEELAA